MELVDLIIKLETYWATYTDTGSSMAQIPLDELDEVLEELHRLRGLED